MKMITFCFDDSLEWDDIQKVFNADSITDLQDIACRLDCEVV